MAYSIAIDGPSGAGKSTIAKIAAKKLGFIYIDTGAMYRAMAIYFMKNQIASDEEEKIKEACETISIRIKYEGEEQQVILNGENVTPLLRTEEAGKMASKTSVYPCVRLKLAELQRELAKTEDVIMDGRDIGTAVLPNADIKIYLTASVETRAKRRFKELSEKEVRCDFEEIKKDIEDRDYQDMNRVHSPLMIAEDATLVDSSYMSIEEVVDTIISVKNEKGFLWK